MTRWLEGQIGDLFDVARGGSPRPIDSYITDDPDGINWIMIGDAPAGSKYIHQTKKKIRAEGLAKSRMVYPGDFLLTNSMSFGRPYITKTQGCIHDGWLVLSPKNRKQIDSDFFYHLLSSPDFRRGFERLAAGAVVKNLNSGLVRSVEVRLPKDVGEQRRIAAILDKADAIRRKREQAFALADDLLKSAFVEMFGDPSMNPRGWETPPLSRQADIQVGHPFASALFSETGIRLCRGANVLPGTLDWGDLRCWPQQDASPYAHLQLCEGDVILALDRPWISSGLKVARTKAEDLPALLVQRVARIRGRSPAHTAYLYEALRHPYFWSYCTPTETTIPHISPVELRNFPLMQPDEPSIERFGEIAQTLLANSDRAKSAAHEADSLFGSLSQRAFRGEL